MAADRVVVVGDCLLDVRVATAGPIRHGGDVPAAIGQAPGGQGANVAVRLARRGRPVRLLAPVAEDAAGAILRDALSGAGVELDPLPAERSGCAVILVDAGGERSMLSDRPPLPADAADRLRSVVADAAAICLSGYALLDPAGLEVAAAAGERPAGMPLAVAGCALGSPDRAAAFRAGLAAARPDLLACNRAEAAELLTLSAGTLSSAALAARLGDALATLAIVTDGAGGSAAGNGAVIEPPAVAGDVVDTTGAGDAYVAALLDCLLGGTWPPGRGVLESAMRAAADLADAVTRVPGAQAFVPGEPGRAASAR